MNLLFVYDCLFPESVGGVEHRQFRLAEALIERGHTVTIAGWGEDAPPDGSKVRFLHLPFQAPLHDAVGKRGIGPTLRFAAAMLTLDLAPYDAVETANIPYLHLFPLARRCRAQGIPLIVTWHEFFGPLWSQYKSRWLAPFFAWIERRAARLGDRVVAVSALTARRLSAARGGDDVPILANGVDPAALGAAAQKAEPAPPILFAGRLIPEKRVDLLIDALAYVKTSWSAPLLGLIGDGPDRARLEALTHERGLDRHIVFLGRRPTADAMWRLLASAKIAVQPSAREGFGMFPLEAMALGVPVVYCAGENNALSDLVRHDIEGLEVAPDPKALAQALTRLFADEALRGRLGASGIVRSALFDWRVLAIAAEAFFTGPAETSSGE
jgi:glycosyltransferase involved in cell wall biosynthesis